MQFFSRNDCISWCKQAKIPAALSFNSSGLGQFKYELNFVCPKESARQLALCDWILDQVEVVPSLLYTHNDALLARDYEMALFDRIRKGYGAIASVETAPGQLFDSESRYDVGGFLFLVMAFKWDSMLAFAKDELVMITSHDEIIRIACSSQKLMDGVGNICQRFNLLFSEVRGAAPAAVPPQPAPGVEPKGAKDEKRE
jgi:hypothetical protein